MTPPPISNDCRFDLLCGEGDVGALTDEDLAEHRTAAPEFPDDSEESIAEFLEGESDYSPGCDYRARFYSKSLDPCARQEAVAWILKVCSYYRFQPLTAYLAVNYFDRFLSAHRLPEAKVWALQLLSVACLSLAAKMEEIYAPSLLDLQVEGARFIFEPRTICKMELLILTALNWRLRSVTPFTFIDFFAHRADSSGTHARHLVSHATQIILATIHDIDFLNHCPSSMAAAAIVCAAGEASDLGLINPGLAISWCTGLTKEGIANCCQFILQESGQKMSISHRMSFLDEASSSSPSPPSNKRRKLNNYFLWLDDDDDDDDDDKNR